MHIVRGRVVLMLLINVCMYHTSDIRVLSVCDAGVLYSILDPTPCYAAKLIGLHPAMHIVNARRQTLR